MMLIWMKILLIMSSVYKKIQLMGKRYNALVVQFTKEVTGLWAYKNMFNQVVNRGMWFYDNPPGYFFFFYLLKKYHKVVYK